MGLASLRWWRFSVLGEFCAVWLRWRPLWLFFRISLVLIFWFGLLVVIGDLYLSLCFGFEFCVVRFECLVL